MKQIKDQNHLSKELSALRKRILHSRWQKAVMVMAAVVLFCTVYALILPAATSTAGDIGAGVEPDERVTAFETSEPAPASSGSGGSESASGDTGTIEVSSQDSSSSGGTDAESNENGSGGTEAGVPASDKGESTGSEGTAGSEGASVSEGGNSGQNAGEAGQPADSGSPAVSDGGSDGTETGDGASTGGSTGSELTGSEGTAGSGGENSGSQTGGEGTVISGEGSGSGQTTGGEDAVISDGSSSEGTVVSEGEGTGAADPSAEEGTLESKENEASVASGGGTSASTDSELLYDENGNPIVTEEAPLDENGDPIVQEELPLEELPAEPGEEEYFVGNLRASEPGSYKVSLAITEDAEIPMDAKLVVSEITDEEAYGAYRSKAADELGAEVSFARFFDISIMSGEEKVEPAEGAAVDVTITLNERVEVPEDGAKYAVHFPNDNDLDEVEIIEASGDPETEVTAPEEDEELIAEIASDEVVSAATEEVSGAEAIEDNEDILSLQAAPKLRSSVKLAAPKSYAVANAAGAVAAEDPEDSKAVSDSELMIGAAEAKAAALEDAGMFDQLDYEDEAELYRFSFKQSTFSVVGTVVTGSISQNVTVRLENGDDATYNITVEGTGIPKDGSLDITVIDESHEDYDRYYAKTLEAIGQPADAAVPARFFDITVLDENDEVIHPEGNFTVSIKLLDEMLVSEDADITAVHFKQDEEGNEEPVVLEKDKVKTSVSYIEEGINTVDSVKFSTDGFSVYAIVGSKMTVRFLSESGDTYKITLDLEKCTNIGPEAVLSIEEIENNSEKYADYVQQAADTLRTEPERLTFARLFNISIYDNGTEIEPNGTVGVEIELEQDLTDTDKIRTVHFSNEGPVVVDTHMSSATDSFSNINFITDSFSVYAVIGEGEIVDVSRLNVNFWNGSNKHTMLVKNADINDDSEAGIARYEKILYDPGSGTLADGVYFLGWSVDDIKSVDGTYYTDEYDGEAYTANTLPKTIEDVRSFIKEYYGRNDVNEGKGIAEGDELNIYPILMKTYQIHYLDIDNINLGTHDVKYRADLDTGNEQLYTVNMAYVVPDDLHNFQGWKVSSGSSNIKDYVEGNIYENGTQITITGDVTFSVNAPEGHWLVFDENGKGATYTAPKFILTDENTEEPDESRMVRKGYTFGGWYSKLKAGESADDTDYTPVDESSAFTFGGKITDKTTLYAKWIPDSTSKYTVIIWRENVAGSGYDFAETVQLSGPTNSIVNTVSSQGTGNNRYARINGKNYNGSDYYGFYLDHFDNNVKILPEGGSVVNVYYNRIVYTLRFFYARSYDRNYRRYIQINNNNEGFIRKAVSSLQDGLTRADGYKDYTRSPGINTWVDVASNSLTSPDQLISRNFIDSAKSVLGEDNVTLKTENYTGNTTVWQNGGGRRENLPMTYYYIEYKVRYGQSLEGAWPDPGVFINQTISGYNTNDDGYVDPRGRAIYPLLWGAYGMGANATAKYKVDSSVSTKGTDHEGNFLLYWRFEKSDKALYRVYFSALPSDTDTIIYKGVRYKEMTDLEYIISTGVSFADYERASFNGASFVEDRYDNTSGTYQGTDYTRTYYAYYTRENYSIIYKDGSYVDGNNNPIEIPEASRLSDHQVSHLLYGTDLSSYNKGGRDYYAFDDQVPEGYVFEGWYIDSACTQEFSGFTTMPQGDITLYAKWRQIQYRVFLHPNTTDATLDWGSDSQEMNFRISYGSKASVPTGRRTGYQFVGWYLDEACSNVFSADAFILNDTTVKSPYDKTTDFTDPMDKYGNGATWNSDAQDEHGNPRNRFWITKKLDLYAKWRAVLEGASGIGVMYDAGEGSNPPSDTKAYVDSSEAIAGAASTPPTGKIFLYWTVQTWVNKTTETDESTGETVTIEGHYEDTETTAFPGDTFTVLKDNAKIIVTKWVNPSDDNDVLEITNPEPGTTPPDTTHTKIKEAQYTVQLKAVYGDPEASTDTHIYWYGNGGKTEDEAEIVKTLENESENLIINKGYPIKPADTFTRDGYEFLGWARMPESTIAKDEQGKEIFDDEGKPVIIYASGEDGIVINDVTYKYDTETGIYTVTGSGTDSKPRNLNADDLYLIYDKENDSYKYGNKTVTQVAADEKMDYEGFYAVWLKLPPVTIEKTDNDNVFLTKATFTLTKMNGEGTFVNYGNESGSYTVADKTDEDEGTVLGTFSVGAESGFYKLTESVAPDGFIILNDSIYFKVDIVDEEARITLIKNVTSRKDEETGKLIVEYDVAMPDDYPNARRKNNSTITVINSPGSALPMTGGHGSLPFTLIGLVLIIGSGLMYGFRMRRRERRSY